MRRPFRYLGELSDCSGGLVRKLFTFLAVCLAAAVAVAVPAPAAAYSECGDPPGSARNVTAAEVSCADAREFARKFADRRITRSGKVTLPGWRAYNATVRRRGSGYDVRASRGKKVVRFQYRAAAEGEGGRQCDPNYSGCLDPSSPDYDCIGGSGNGPDYTGMVQVLGEDHFDLDRDGDGVGCDS
jgi:hypothetical protein